MVAELVAAAPAANSLGQGRPLVRLIAYAAEAVAERLPRMTAQGIAGCSRSLIDICVFSFVSGSGAEPPLSNS